MLAIIKLPYTFSVFLRRLTLVSWSAASENLGLSCYQIIHHGHSNETAVPEVNSVLIDAVSDGKITLSLWDLTATLGTIEHNILLRRLETAFRFRGVSLQRTRSYLDRRTQSVLLKRKSTAPALYGIHQGFVLRSLLFTLYTANIDKCRGANVQCRGTSDVQMCIWCTPSTIRFPLCRMPSDWTRTKCHKDQYSTRKHDCWWIGILLYFNITQVKTMNNYLHR